MGSRYFYAATCFIVSAVFSLSGCGKKTDRGTPLNSDYKNNSTDSSTLSAPSNPSISAGNSLNTLSWNAVPGATGYNIYWSTSSSVSKTTGTIISGASAPYVHALITNDTAYYYVVTAYNATNIESAVSSIVTATPNSTQQTLQTPTGLTTTVSGTTITLSWNPVSNATEYNVYWGTTPDVTTASTKISGLTEPNFQHTDITADTTYYYMVTSVNSSGESTSSTITPPTGTGTTGYITLGSTKSEITSIQGAPESISYQSGYYTYSYGLLGYFIISNTTNTVTRWTSYNNGLKVKMVPGSNTTSATAVTIGSHVDDVINVQGTPTSITNSPTFYTYSYGSLGFFTISNTTNTVTQWTCYNIGLKVKIVPGNYATSATAITVGSHVDDVIKIQGTPTSITNSPNFYTYSYGSLGFFTISNTTNTVTQWTDYGGLIISK